MPAEDLTRSIPEGAGSWLSGPGAKRLQVRLAFFLVACIALVVTAVQSYRDIDSELTGVTLSRRIAVAQLAAATVSEKFDHLVDVGVALATRVRFRALIEEGRWDDAVAILRAVPGDLPFIERLFLTDIHGTLRADVPHVPEVRGVDFSHRDWYQGVRRHWEPYVSPVYQRAAPPRLNVFAAAMPIKSSDGRVLGVLVLQMRLDAYFEWIRGIDVGAWGGVYVVDPKGQLAFDSRSPGTAQIADVSALPVVQRVRRGEQAIEVAFDPISGRETVSAFSPVRTYGWGVIVQQPAAVAFEAKNQQLRRLLVAYGLVLFLFAAVVYLGARFVLQRRRAEQGQRLQAELERRVVERTAQLEAANKELESFSYSVSHDLRTPLRAIDGYSRMLEEDYGGRLDDEGRRLLGVVRNGARGMGQLIDDLLEFSRLGRKALVFAVVDMESMARQVWEELAGPETRHEIHIASLPAGRGDPVLLRQVWANLLSNAIKFSGRSPRPRVEVSGHDDGAGNVVYCVKDNGAGFDMRYYDKLFGVFQRLHRVDEYPGTGVGLAIVQRVVARHGGRAWAEGRPGEGASFHFSLPKAGPDGKAATNMREAT